MTHDPISDVLHHWLDNVGEFDIEDIQRFPWVNQSLAAEEIRYMLEAGLIERSLMRYKKREHKSPKLVFLDVDGVLNSSCGGNFKDVCLKNLKRIIDETGAIIVLVSSWKSGWHKEEKALQDEYGDYLDKTLADYGLEIFDKSSRFTGGRTVDVLDWILKTNADGFVVLDDESYLYTHPLILQRCVFTSFRAGLTADNATKAIEILKRGI